MSPFVAQMAAFSTFAVGFVARPFGGALFGHFGDLLGRKVALATAPVAGGFARTYALSGTFTGPRLPQLHAGAPFGQLAGTVGRWWLPGVPLAVLFGVGALAFVMWAGYRLWALPVHISAAGWT